jgi:hypothetical protein
MIEYTVLDRVEHHTCGMSLSDVAFMTPPIRWVHPSYFIFNQKKNKIKEPNAYEQLEVRNDYWQGGSGGGAILRSRIINPSSPSQTCNAW